MFRPSKLTVAEGGSVAQAPKIPDVTRIKKIHVPSFLFDEERTLAW